jgi:hypothetical protein
MSNKLTAAIALAAGFIGGSLSQRITPVLAQNQAPVQEVVRARKFLLVDEQGVDRGAFGFYKDEKGRPYPSIEFMRGNGHVSSTGGVRGEGRLLPDETCSTCSRIAGPKKSTNP